ncbi:MAG: hypothetical protein RI963_3454 [Planctomycetota bacterium]|jgi:hypothetical protein
MVRAGFTTEDTEGTEVFRRVARVVGHGMTRKFTEMEKKELARGGG